MTTNHLPKASKNSLKTKKKRKKRNQKKLQNPKKMLKKIKTDMNQTRMIIKKTTKMTSRRTRSQEKIPTLRLMTFSLTQKETQNLRASLEL